MRCKCVARHGCWVVVVKRDDGSRGPDVTWTPKKKPLAEAYSACLRLSEPIGGERELAAALRARARGELGRLGLRRPASAGIGLTQTERRVVGLAASGLTNREIAAQLFISPKTVQANLGKVYEKLGIHSRAELGAQAARRGLQT